VQLPLPAEDRLTDVAAQALGTVELDSEQPGANLDVEEQDLVSAIQDLTQAIQGLAIEARLLRQQMHRDETGEAEPIQTVDAPAPRRGRGRPRKTTPEEMAG
jgi:hypothetical protein